MATRCLVRDGLRRTRRHHAAACGALGAAALEEGLGVERSARPWAVAAREARARAEAAAAEEELNLARLGGAVLPVAARHVARETAALGKPLLHEVRARLFPRVPALAGLAVGWWVASTFTDSAFSATLHGLGIGIGPRRAVSTETLRAMEFWLPIVAAAMCSYGSGRLSALVRARYAPARRDDAASSAVGDG